MIDDWRKDFVFICPNKNEVINQLLDKYSEGIHELDFDGVFLDRIRMTSPSVGFEMLFSCFCTQCRDKYYKKSGEDLFEFVDLIKKYFDKLKNNDVSFFGQAKSLGDLVYSKELQPLLDFRKASIFELVKKFSDIARQNQKKVGLDLFSPSLAKLVSQDYELLGGLSDWIKPMIYCKANGPAGISLELHSLLKSLVILNNNKNERKLLELCKVILGIDLPKKIDDLLINGVSQDLFLKEVENINNMNLKTGVKNFPGIETVNISNICEMQEENLGKYLVNINKSNVEGIVLSWNLLETPLQNLIFIGDFLDR